MLTHLLVGGRLKSLNLPIYFYFHCETEIEHALAS